LLLAAGLAFAQQRLQLKNRPAAVADDPLEYLAAPVKRRSLDRSHLLIEFREARAELLGELERRGARILRYVPEAGFMVSAPDELRLDGLEVRWAGRLLGPDKLSPLLASSGRLNCLVEFHPDVEPSEARALAAEHLLEVLEHPDLRPNELLVAGDAAGLARLAEWDEVSYIYPASEDLIEGRPVEACRGALTAWGPLAQYVAHAGEGWDGPGRNPAELGYFLAQLARLLPRERVRTEILRALEEWARYVQLRFAPAADEWAPRSLRFLFASGAHGDPYPFDGRGRVLAHAFYPVPLNPEPIAGDVHFDDDEPWAAGGYLDVFSVALHEIGHALGLGHSDRPGAVMYPYYRQLAGLSRDDVAAIRELYAAREEPSAPQPPATPPSTPAAPPTPPPNPQPPSTPTTPSTPTNPTNPQPPAPPKPPAGPDTVAPSLTIVYPAAATLLTSASAVTLRGTASDNVAVTEVLWSSSTGASGLAQGTTQWTAGPIPLNQGINTLVVRARDAAGNSGWRSVVVTRR